MKKLTQFDTVRNMDAENSLVQTASKDIQILHPKKREFLSIYKQIFGHISNTARAIGIHRQTFYDWKNTDPVFAKELAEADAELNDEIQDVLIKKAGEGDLGAVIFYLKNKHPDYRQSKDTNVAVQVNFNEVTGKQKDDYGI